MYPYLIEWHYHGDLVRIPSYGVLLALAFSVAYFEALRRAVITGEQTKDVENLFLVVVAASVVGARLFHVLFEEPSYYWQNPGKIVALWEGGYVFYGALLLSSLGIFAYCRHYKISFLPYADIAAPSTALGLFIGRIGCFLAGCCWGVPTKVPWAVTFRHADTFSSVRNVAVHPTQIYEAVGGLAIYLYLTWKYRRRAYTGQIFFHGLAIYSVMRFIIERYRGDDVRGFLLNGLVSYSQLISLAILPFAVFGMRYFSRKSVKR